MRKLEQERASKGLCICCGAPTLPKKGGGYMRVCQYHRDKNREYDKNVENAKQNKLTAPPNHIRACWSVLILAMLPQGICTDAQIVI